VAKYVLRTITCVYLLFLLILPIGLIGYRSFSGGLQPVIDALTSEDFVSALKVTIEVAAFAVVLNTIFGIVTALVLTRTRFPGKRLLNALVDLPLAVSPVVVGLALILVYGKFAPVGGWFERHGIQIIFNVPGMVFATVFVSLPLVVRSARAGGPRSAGSRCRASGGRWSTASCCAWPVRSASTARSRWSPAASSIRPRP
jgi:sulfate/thiosulfate transport system permease protein